MEVPKIGASTEYGVTDRLTATMLHLFIPGISAPVDGHQAEAAQQSEATGSDAGMPLTVWDAARAVVEAMGTGRDAPKTLAVGVRYWCRWFEVTHGRDAQFPVTEEEMVEFLRAHELIPTERGFTIALDKRVDQTLTQEKLKRNGPPTTDRLEDVIDALNVLHAVCSPTQNPVDHREVTRLMTRMGLRKRRRPV